MSALVMVCKGQRIDLTCHMKDADKTLALFGKHHIRFNKKYTSISKNAPSTITFVGIRAEDYAEDISNLATELHMLAHDNEIGNVYMKFVRRENEEKNNQKNDPVKKTQKKHRFGPEENNEENDISNKSDDSLTIDSATWKYDNEKDMTKVTYDA